MELKFYLNKLVKTERVEDYTLSSLLELKQVYQDFLDKTEGTDPDFPMMNFGGKKGKKIKGTNVYANYDEDNPDPNFKGLEDLADIDLTRQEPNIMHLEDIRRMNNASRNKNK